jgi:hypothetical protein
MLKLRTRLCALAAILAGSTLAGLMPPAASASSGQSVFFEAPAELLSPVTRPKTIATLRKLGVSALRVELYWHSVAPAANSSRRPAFDATNPASYHWGQYDPLIEEAHKLGWKVLLTVTSPVPRWATANPRGTSLVYRPSSRQFEEFITAVGRHYGGEVSLFALWNEPNHHEFLQPQFNSNGTPASPRIYRSLYQAGYAGLQAAGIAHPTVLMGETAPEGETYARRPVRSSTGSVGPLLFLREALCLRGDYHRSGACGELQAEGYATHPYPNAAGPLYVPRNPETITISVLSRLTRALDLAARAGALPAHLPVYVTEFGIMSKPNRYQGVPAPQQAEYDAISERLAYQNPRVASFAQYLLKDDPLSGRAGSGKIGFQTGLRYFNGSPKPLFASFPVPLTVSRRGGGYSLWGFVRPAAGATTLTVEVQPRNSYRFRKLAQVSTNALGYWTLGSFTAGGHWRVRWMSPAGILYAGPSTRAY